MNKVNSWLEVSFSQSCSRSVDFFPQFEKQHSSSNVHWVVTFAKVKFCQRISIAAPRMANSFAETKVAIFVRYSGCVVESFWHSHSWRLPCILAVVFSIISRAQLLWPQHILAHLLWQSWALHFWYTLSLWCWNCINGIAIATGCDRAVHYTSNA